MEVGAVLSVVFAVGCVATLEVVVLYEGDFVRVVLAVEYCVVCVARIDVVVLYTEVCEGFLPAVGSSVTVTV